MQLSCLRCQLVSEICTNNATSCSSQYWYCSARINQRWNFNCPRLPEIFLFQSCFATRPFCGPAPLDLLNFYRQHGPMDGGKERPIVFFSITSTSDRMTREPPQRQCPTSKVLQLTYFVFNHIQHQMAVAVRVPSTTNSKTNALNDFY